MDSKKNFVIFFHGQEGSSAIVRYLNNCSDVSIIRQKGEMGWEPFDKHSCGSMSLSNLKRCFDLIFGSQTVDFKALNEIYLKSAPNVIESFPKSLAVGFKMRFNLQNFFPPRTNQNEEDRIYQHYQESVFDLFKRHHVNVFMLIRRDLLRWAISKYCEEDRKFVQFAIANGSLKKKSLSKTQIDCSRLEEIIQRCKEVYTLKKLLILSAEQKGLNVFPIYYEDFCQDLHLFLKKFLKKLQIQVSDEAIKEAVAQGIIYKKVHSHRIEDFVINHEEVAERFMDRSFAWN